MVRKASMDAVSMEAFVLFMVKGEENLEILLNGKKEILSEEMTLEEFLKLKGLEPERIVVEVNLEIVKKDDWRKFTLKENDRLEVLRFVGGG